MAGNGPPRRHPREPYASGHNAAWERNRRSRQPAPGAQPERACNANARFAVTRATSVSGSWPPARSCSQAARDSRYCPAQYAATANSSRHRQAWKVSSTNRMSPHLGRASGPGRTGSGHCRARPGGPVPGVPHPWRTAIIVLIQRGEGPGMELALARSPHFRAGVYSAIASFDRQGPRLATSGGRPMA